MPPSPVTLAYCRRLVPRLVADGKLLLVEGATTEQVASSLAEALTGLGNHAGLISNTVRVLVTNPLVDELYVDDEELQQIVNSLRQ
jgi:hypothetical protein